MNNVKEVKKTEVVNRLDVGQVMNQEVTELEKLKAELARVSELLAKATKPKQPRFSCVGELYKILACKINEKGLLPDFTKEDVENMLIQIQSSMLKEGVNKEYKLISIKSDIRFFAITLEAIQGKFTLVPV